MTSNTEPCLSQSPEEQEEQEELASSPAIGDAHSARLLAVGWTPGLRYHIPWPAFAAFIGALICIAVMIVVLELSNGDEVDNWRVQPSVYLAICTACVNVCLRFAFSRGTAIQWWNKSISQETTLADLHKLWSLGESVLEAIRPSRHLSLLRFATVACTILPFSSPLLQRASKVSTMTTPTPVNLTIPMARTIPDGYTGWVSTRGLYPSIPTTNFTQVVMDYTNRVIPSISNSGCNGNCPAKVRGAGFRFNCTNITLEYDLRQKLYPNGTVNETSMLGAQVFSVNYEYSERGAEVSYDNGTDYLQPYLGQYATFKPMSPCNGTLLHRRCAFYPATMEYPVLMNNASITLAPGSTYHDDIYINNVTVGYSGYQGMPSTMSGIYLMLNNAFSSSAWMNFGGAIGYQIATNGTPAIQYSENVDVDVEGCQATWTDPTEDLLNAAREVMFRTSLRVAYGDSNMIQIIPSNATHAVVIYQSDYRYLGLSLLITCIGMTTIFPMLLGWWNLGRNVTMSPLELAKAFNAPLFAAAPSNATISQLLRRLGTRKIWYGLVNGSAEYGDTAEIGAEATVGVKDEDLRLEINDTSRTESLK
ncbi:hypothetical protein F5884DRAFT_851252 [Xylogone sp. PMI_703]|nr:hypothetical protein F5884DRAFT_851252 [Xylogone sp. PMI_703]